MRLPVYVDGWQIECCMDPPSVGDRVAWLLTFTEQADDDHGRGYEPVELDLVATILNSGTLEDGPRYGVLLRTPTAPTPDFSGLDLGGLDFGDPHLGDPHLGHLGGNGAQDATVGLSLYWVSRKAVQGRVRLSGYVGEDHHAGVPESFPESHGIVRGIRVVTQRLAEADPTLWAPTGEPPSYEDVTTSPKWFRTLPRTGTVRTSQTGILVDLEITTGPA